MPTPRRPQGDTAKIIRSVALPSEHGGWGFLFEPILLGLCTAFTLNGLILAGAVICIFLIHQPLKTAIKDHLKSRRPARTIWAERFVIGYGVVGGLFMFLVLNSAGTAFLLPFMLAVPLLLIQLIYDSRNQSRALIPEIFGAIALGSTASAIALLDGWPLESALVLWLLLGLRTIPAIIYVRARLKLEHRNPVSPVPTWLTHIAAVFIGLMLRAAGLAPSTAVVAYLILQARAMLGLSAYRKPRKAKHIGFMELGYGLLTVFLLAVGYIAGI